jgi:hypothetical protein
VIKKHDRGQTPHQRALTDPGVRKMAVIRMNAQFKTIHPAALSRQILALAGRLQTIATAKKPAPVKPAVTPLGTPPPRRASQMRQRLPTPGGIDMRQQAVRDVRFAKH